MCLFVFFIIWRYFYRFVADFGFLALTTMWPDTIHAFISIKHGFTMLNVEGKMHQLVCLQGERERERKREQQKEGGRELFHWKMLWLHLLSMSCFCIQNYSTCSSISPWKRVTNHWCLINIAATTTDWFKWRLRRVHTPAAIWRLLHNILVAQENAESQQMINKGFAHCLSGRLCAFGLRLAVRLIREQSRLLKADAWRKMYS